MQYQENTENRAGYRETDLGWLPEEWEVVQLDDLNIETKEGLNPANFPEESFEYYSIPAYQENKKPA